MWPRLIIAALATALIVLCGMLSSNVLKAQTYLPLTGAGATGVSLYTGPGDIVSWNAWWGQRAYSSATRGNKLMNVCNSTGGVDVGCADLFSSASTGDIVAATVSGITCPGNVNCTIKTLYDLTGNTFDVTNSTIASRPTFQTSAFGGSRTCLAFNGSQWLTASSSSWATQPTSDTWVAERTGNTSAFNAVFKGVTDGNNTGFNGGANAAYMYSGAVVTETANDNSPHSVQVRYTSGAGADAKMMVDGTLFSGLDSFTIIGTGNFTISGTSGSQNVTGVICEVGHVNSDQSSNFSTLTSNQRTWYGF